MEWHLIRFLSIFHFRYASLMRPWCKSLMIGEYLMLIVVFCTLQPTFCLALQMKQVFVHTSQHDEKTNCHHFSVSSYCWIRFSLICPICPQSHGNLRWNPQDKLGVEPFSLGSDLYQIPWWQYCASTHRNHIYLRVTCLIWTLILYMR